jgi:hypothetical protein
MKSEREIREMLVIIDALGSPETPANVLRWVLNEYPGTVNSTPPDPREEGKRGE